MYNLFIIYFFFKYLFFVKLCTNYILINLSRNNLILKGGKGIWFLLQYVPVIQAKSSTYYAIVLWYIVNQEAKQCVYFTRDNDDIYSIIFLEVLTSTYAYTNKFDSTLSFMHPGFFILKFVYIWCIFKYIVSQWSGYMNRSWPRTYMPNAKNGQSCKNFDFFNF